MDLYAWMRAVRDADITATAALTAYVLATYMDGDGVCWPSRRRIAVGIRRSPSTVTRALRELEGAGLLVTTHQFNGPSTYRRSEPPTHPCVGGLRMGATTPTHGCEPNYPKNYPIELKTLGAHPCESPNDDHDDWDYSSDQPF